MSLQSKAEAISKQLGIFLGGPVQKFEKVGRSQLIILLKNGLYTHSKVLDVGCGVLRGGYWLINFLEPECYFGIEPNKKMLEAGIERLLGKMVMQQKKPSFANNDDFDFSVFKTKYDFVIARSIWTHSSKVHIQKMLDSFIQTKSPSGVFLTSYLRAGFLGKQDYKGINWVGHDQKSDMSGMVHHSFRWIDEECKSRSLRVKELQDEIIGNQIWLRIE